MVEKLLRHLLFTEAVYSISMVSKLVELHMAYGIWHSIAWHARFSWRWHGRVGICLYMGALSCTMLEISGLLFVFVVYHSLLACSVFVAFCFAGIGVWGWVVDTALHFLFLQVFCKL
ncbi:hypothetical protein BJ508DRAFT_138070 [Ascobolus immersus RN42]|uniref:Uncharacterized protein n=1 Tax=Ascobolus immersus RN42 TaxID=1160509 RepID=A0A3N4I0Z6_ASCIM|nr:hypothetical protein BJ508DRAFT_138070 [Ascobolus immersus RN42]